MGKKIVMRKFDGRNIFTALLLSILVFSLGLFLGNYIANKKMEVLLSNEEKIRLKTLGFEIQNLILPGYLCNSSIIEFVHEDLRKIGGRLSSLESQVGWDNPEVMRLKEFYSLMEIRSWALVNKYKRECNSDIDWILYFYSNKGDCKDCWLLGNVLNSVFNEKGRNLVIYSFDKNIENPALDSVKKIYNVSVAPTLIINGKKYEGFMDKREILNLL